jgi:hypothetical protein
MEAMRSAAWSSFGLVWDGGQLVLIVRLGKGGVTDLSSMAILGSMGLVGDGDRSRLRVCMALVGGLDLFAECCRQGFLIGGKGLANGNFEYFFLCKDVKIGFHVSDLPANVFLVCCGSGKLEVLDLTNMVCHDVTF